MGSIRILSQSSCGREVLRRLEGRLEVLTFGSKQEIEIPLLVENYGFCKGLSLTRYTVRTS